MEKKLFYRVYNNQGVVLNSDIQTFGNAIHLMYFAKDIAFIEESSALFHEGNILGNTIQHIRYYTREDMEEDKKRGVLHFTDGEER